MALLAGVSIVAAPPAQASGSNPEMVSVLPSTDYVMAFAGSVSGDGRFVAFHTAFEDGGLSHVYLRDRSLQTTTRITPHYAPSMPLSSPGSNGAYPTISGNGRFVAFQTQQAYDDLDFNRTYDIYVYDRLTTRLRWASHGLGLGGVDHLLAPAISDDGRFIAFTSDSSAMSAGDTNGSLDVFLYDQQLDETQLVSTGVDGIAANGRSYEPSISGNGRYVAFGSLASNLVPAGDDTNGVDDIFIRDLQTEATKRISVSPSGAEFTSDSAHPSISGAGSRVVFANNKTAYLHDVAAGTTSMLPESDLYGPYTQSVSISRDGSRVAWLTMGIVAPGRAGLVIELHDLASGSTTVESLRYSGDPVQDLGSFSGYRISLSDDARFLTFSSDDDFVVPDDPHAGTDVFLRDTSAPPTTGTVDYVAFGDSLTTGFSIPDCDGDPVTSPTGCSGQPTVEPYPELVFVRSAPAYQALARAGIWGYTVEEARSDYESGWNAKGGWMPQLKVIDRAQSLVTGALGINDMKWSETETWIEACLRLTCQAYADALIAQRRDDFDLLFRKLEEAAQRGVKVVVPLYYNPIEDLPDCSSSHEIAEVIVDTLNDEFRERALASSTPITVVDVHSRFIGHGMGAPDSERWVFGDTCDDTSAVIASIFPDWVTPENDAEIPINRDPHPNSKGSSEIADAILEEI